MFAKEKNSRIRGHGRCNPSLLLENLQMVLRRKMYWGNLVGECSNYFSRITKLILLINEIYCYDQIFSNPYSQWQWCFTSFKMFSYVRNTFCEFKNYHLWTEWVPTSFLFKFLDLYSLLHFIKEHPCISLLHVYISHVTVPYVSNSISLIREFYWLWRVI